MQHDDSRYDRRDFLRFAGFGAASLALRGFASPTPSQKFAGGNGTVRISLRAENGECQIYPGQATRMKHYVGELLEGSPDSLQPIPYSFAGPIIRLNKGDVFKCEFTNRLSDPTIVHWHGMNTPDSADGHPRFSVLPDASYYYEFPVINRAGTYWFHPHPDGQTGPQVYAGMAGLMIVRDPQEQALPLPRGDYDVPLIIQDRTFDNQNQFVYTPHPFHGMLGSKILVNGHADYVLSAATRVYRLRVHNGSSARVYKLNWSDDTPMWVIGTDGGLLDKPRFKPYVMLAPGERVELWADFSRHPLGSQITLKSRTIQGLAVGFGGGGIVPNGAALDIMRVSIDRQESESLKLPTTLTPLEKYSVYDAVNPGEPRRFAITFDGMFLVNGAPFEMLSVAANEIVRNGTLEQWEFTNDTGTQMLVHPMHLHGSQFQVIKRQVAQAQKVGWEGVRYGYTDEGWKDTIMLMPGERVRFLVKFGPYPGLFLYHCHNLEHEDMGMMRNFRIDP
jgi:FtsP/CotA-like multicopper oxidase with cupredoxin domain